MDNTLKLFVHGRPSGHPLHMKYGRSIADRIEVEDPWIRWHDKSLVAPLRYLAWVANAFFFVRFRKTIAITEGLRITLVLARIFSFGNLKLIALVDDESPYFIYSNYYSWLSKRMNGWAYRQYSAWICIGKMETELTKLIVRKHNCIFTGYNGISQERLPALLAHKYNPSGHRVVFIGNIAAKWRSWYKGLDLMVSAMDELISEGMDLCFDIAGEIDAKIVGSLKASCKNPDGIRFVGRIDALSQFFEGAVLYLHTARGEGWGITVNEAMASGVVPVVSEWTGAKECVEEVSASLVVPLDKSTIKEKIKWFIGLSDKEKIGLSEKCKQVSKRYTENNAISTFRKLFDEAVQRL